MTAAKKRFCPSI